MLLYGDAVERCYYCKNPWIRQGTFNYWFKEYYWWLEQGRCSHAKAGPDPFRKTLDPINFSLCLLEWYDNDSIGATYGEDLKLDPDMMRLQGFMAYGNVKMLEGFESEGIDLVDDMNRITKWFGLPTTRATNKEFIKIEAYRVFFWE